MSRLWQTNGIELVLLGAVLAAFIVVAIYVIAKVREQTKESRSPSSEILSNFEELHASGELSDQEFRSIRSMLHQRMQSEMTAPTKSAAEKPVADSPRRQTEGAS